MKQNDEKAFLADYLKKIVEQNGNDYLGENAYGIYRQLLEKKSVSPLSARMLLLALLSEVHQKSLELVMADAISQHIEECCCLNRDMAGFLASIFAEVYSEANQEKWRKKAGTGLKKFCRKEWEFVWEGESKWRAGGGSVDCFCNAKATVKVVNPQQVADDLKAMLAKNPLLSEKEIFAHYQDELCDQLDSDFDDYCTSDKYYEPVVEDYTGNYEYVVKEFCQKHGMELMEFECNGGSTDFEPDDDYRSGRW